MCVTSLCLLCIACVPCAYCEETAPKVAVSNIRRVYHNGEHNAFTDLVLFHGRYYLTFRSCPDGHMVFSTSTIIILVSDDLQTWQQVHRFGVPQRDTRDPHFLVFQDRLFVYTGTWYSDPKLIARDGRDLNLHLGYAAWSDDGTHWNSPIMLEGTFGHYVWRAATYNGKAYLCGRRKIQFEVTAKGERREVESVMLESDDGLVWKKRSFFQEIDGDETAFRFMTDGTIVAIGRRGNQTAQLLRSKPPYTQWDRKSLDRYVGGPIITSWNGKLVVGGRKAIGDQGPKTSMCWLIEDQLVEFAELPSGGDNSYPGFLELDSRRAIMSWYSSHEKDANGKAITAIYLADLSLSP